MPEHEIRRYDEEGEENAIEINGRFLYGAEKTPEQLRQAFREKWEENLVNSFPILQEGESQFELYDRNEIFQRPHAEVYSVYTEDWGEEGSMHVTPLDHQESHVEFILDATEAGFHIETTVVVPTPPIRHSRQVAEQFRIPTPLASTVTFVLRSPSQETPQK